MGIWDFEVVQNAVNKGWTPFDSSYFCVRYRSFLKLFDRSRIASSFSPKTAHCVTSWGSDRESIIFRTRPPTDIDGSRWSSADGRTDGRTAGRWEDSLIIYILINPLIFISSIPRSSSSSGRLKRSINRSIESTPSVCLSTKLMMIARPVYAAMLWIHVIQLFPH